MKLAKSDVSRFVSLTGRVQSYIEDDRNGLMPVSCTMYKYFNDIYDYIKYLSVALRGGAGISVCMDDFVARKPQPNAQFFFYLPEDHPDYADLSEEQLKYWRSVASDVTIIHVNDSMEEDDAEYVSIQSSWKLFIDALEKGLTPVVDLSRIRPKNTANDKGLVASGATSFLTIYEAILNHINKGDLISLMQLGGQMNEILRRGGCVSGDTWIQTTEGARQVRDLVGTKFTAISNGEEFNSGDEGFWSTGIQDVYELTTTGGQKVKLTKNHQMLKKVSKTKSEWAKLENIVIGDYVLLNEHRVIPSWEGTGSFQLGWLIGQVIGDGTVQHRNNGRSDQATVEFFGEFAELQTETAIRYLEMENLKHPTANKFTGSKTLTETGVEKWRVRSSELAKSMSEFGIIPNNKYVTPEVERYGSSEFYAGLLRGLFDADGTVRNASNHKDSRCIVLAQTNIHTMYAVQRMLLRLGIQSSIYTNSKTYNSGVLNGYDVKQDSPASQLVITRDNIEIFRDVIGFSMPDKIEKLNTLLESYTQGITECLFEVKVKSIEYVGQEEVYDCTIEDVHEFDGNGFRLHNCFKNGIVTFSLHHSHPDIIRYLNVPLADIPGSGKKAIRLDTDVLENKRLMKLIEVRVNDKSLFMMKTVFKTTRRDGTDEYFVGKPQSELKQMGVDLEQLYAQVCLTGDTLVLTRDGHYPIETLVNKEVEVWDGERYVRINNFKKTGVNQPIYQVKLKDGRTVKATAYHTFILDDGSKKKLHELEEGDLLQEHYIGVDGFLSTKSAYMKGFLVAEGTTTSNNPLLWIYEPKFPCLSRLIESANETEIGVVNNGAKTKVNFVDAGEKRYRMQGLVVRKHELYDWCSQYKQRLPLTEMLNWETKYKCEFIAGVMDGDGTVIHRLKNGNPCYAISSIHLGWLEDFQILLRSLGIRTTINLMQTGGIRDFGENHGGEYYCKTAYRLSFNTAASQKLGSLVTFSRLQNWRECDKVKSFTIGSYNEIVSIEQLDNEDVYCCGVPTTNAFALSNGLMTGNCVEILLLPTATCLLLNVNYGQINTIDEIETAYIEATVLGIDIWKTWKADVGDSTSQYLSADKDRQIGICPMGLANLLSHLNITYGKFVRAMEAFLDNGFYPTNSPEYRLVLAIDNAHMKAAALAREAGLERFLSIKPDQSNAYRGVDLKGNTTCKNINPPLQKRVRRTSHTVDTLAGVYYHGNVETIQSVIEENGVEIIQRLWEGWQRLMNRTGLAHCCSFDLYCEIDEAWLKDFLTRSPLVTTYYMVADKVNQDYLNKSRANTATNDLPTGVCAIDNPGSCESCAE